MNKIIGYVGDIDIDFPNRNHALQFLDHVPASILRTNKLDKHNTGVYFHAVPMDPITGLACLPYDVAENIGWYKIDLLNVGVYEQVKNEKHLLELMERDIDWRLFEYPDFTSKLIHLGNHAELTAILCPKSISDIAILLALIRPGKKHLIEKCKTQGFLSITDEIWSDTGDGSYFFKKAHAHGYAMLVKVHANLLIEYITA
jgi:DNA polymerase III alpha subunit